MKLKGHYIVIFLSKVFITCTINVISTQSSQAQQPKILEDSIRYYLNLSAENWHNDIELSTKIAKLNYHLSKNTDNPALKAAATAQYGVAFYSNADYDSALYYYNDAIKISIENNLSFTPYLIYKLAVLGKKSEYLNIINVIDQFDIQEDSLKVDLLISQITASLEIGFTKKADSALQVLDKIPAHKVGSKNKLQIAKKKGAYYSKIADYAKSDSILLDVLGSYLERNNYLDAAETYMVLAENAMSISRYKVSSDYLQNAEELYQRVNYNYGLAYVLILKGSLYSYLNEYNISSENLFNALRFFEENKNLNKMQNIYYELGWIYYKQSLYDRAQNYLKKAIQIAKKIKNLNALGAAYNTKGALFQKLQQYDSAKYYYELSISYYKKTKNRKSEAAILFNKGMILDQLGFRKEALSIYRETYKIDSDLNNILGLVQGELVIGQYFLNNSQLDSSKYYLNLAEKRAKELSNDVLLLDVYKSKAELFIRKGESKNANDYLHKALNHQEHLNLKEKQSKIIEIEILYDLKNKEKELAYLNAEKENSDKIIALSNQKIRSQRNTLIALSIGIILLITLIYIVFKYTQIKLKTNKKLKKLYTEIQEKQEEIMAQSEELQESNDRIIEMNNFLEKKVLERTQEMRKAHAELDKFFYRASHDFRGPLTTMMGLVEVSKLTTSDPDVNKLFDNVNLTALKLDKMVRKLQSISFLSDFQKLPEPQLFDLPLLLNEIQHKFEKEYSEKDINFEIQLNTQGTVVFFPDLLKICLNNLIENSIIFNKSKIVKLKLFIKEENNQLHITLKDNGVGIGAEWQDNIFEMFEKSSEISKGNGLGLYIVKKAIIKLKGEIKLESKVNEGTTFYLILPINKSSDIDSSKMPLVISK